MNAYYCVQFSSRGRISFIVWLVSGYAHVFIQLSVVVVTLLCATSLFDIHLMSHNNGGKEITGYSEHAYR